MRRIHTERCCSNVTPLVLAITMTVGCTRTPNYRSLVIQSPPTNFFDGDAVGDVAERLNKSYSNALLVCSKRLGALEEEYGSIARTTASWRTALLVAGGISGLATASYAVAEEDPDPKVVGALGLFSTATLSANFGFLTESDRLATLDSDAARIAGDLGAVRASSEQLERAGLTWSRLPSTEECANEEQACSAACSGNNDCIARCKSKAAECVSKEQQAHLNFDEARAQFFSAIRVAHLGCLAGR